MVEELIIRLQIRARNQPWYEWTGLGQPEVYQMLCQGEHRAASWYGRTLVPDCELLLVIGHSISLMSRTPFFIKLFKRKLICKRHRDFRSFLSMFVAFIKPSMDSCRPLMLGLRYSIMLFLMLASRKVFIVSYDYSCFSL